MKLFIIYKYLYDIFCSYQDNDIISVKISFEFIVKCQRDSRSIGQARFNTPSTRGQLTLWRDRRTWITVSKSDVWPCTITRIAIIKLAIPWYRDTARMVVDTIIYGHVALICLLTRVTVYPQRVINSCMRSEPISFRKVLERNINPIYILYARTRDYKL